MGVNVFRLPRLRPDRGRDGFSGSGHERPGATATNPRQQHRPEAAVSTFFGEVGRRPSGRGVLSSLFHRAPFAGRNWMTNHVRRREFITLLGGAAAAWPLAARAQLGGKLPTIGYLASTPATESQLTAAFAQRLRELGWIEGRSVAI